MNDLRAFEKVAATKSFAPAARARGLPRSSVSRSIARLEREIAARPFQRTTREVALTPTGGQHLLALVNEENGAHAGGLQVSRPNEHGVSATSTDTEMTAYKPPAWLVVTVLAGRILAVHVDNPRNDAFARGAILFDAGAFFEAHEAWETGWRVETDPTQRRFLQGLIQVAAGFHKLLAIGSVDSASSLLAKGMAKLEACPPEVGGADAMTFRDGVRACADDLAAGRFDRAAIPKVGTTRP